MDRKPFDVEHFISTLLNVKGLAERGSTLGESSAGYAGFERLAAKARSESSHMSLAEAAAFLSRVEALRPLSPEARAAADAVKGQRSPTEQRPVFSDEQTSAFSEVRSADPSSEGSSAPFEDVKLRAEVDARARAAEVRAAAARRARSGGANAAAAAAAAKAAAAAAAAAEHRRRTVGEMVFKLDAWVSSDFYELVGQITQVSPDTGFYTMRTVNQDGTIRFWMARHEYVRAATRAEMKAATLEGGFGGGASHGATDQSAYERSADAAQRPAGARTWIAAAATLGGFLLIMAAINSYGGSAASLHGGSAASLHGGSAASLHGGSGTSVPTALVAANKPVLQPGAGSGPNSTSSVEATIANAKLLTARLDNAVRDFYQADSRPRAVAAEYLSIARALTVQATKAASALRGMPGTVAQKDDLAVQAMNLDMMADRIGQAANWLAGRAATEAAAPEPKASEERSVSSPRVNAPAASEVDVQARSSASTLAADALIRSARQAKTAVYQPSVEMFHRNAATTATVPAIQADLATAKVLAARSARDASDLRQGAATVPAKAVELTELANYMDIMGRYYAKVEAWLDARITAVNATNARRAAQQAQAAEQARHAQDQAQEQARQQQADAALEAQQQRDDGRGYPSYRPADGTETRPLSAAPRCVPYGPPEYHWVRC